MLWQIETPSWQIGGKESSSIKCFERISPDSQMVPREIPLPFHNKKEPPANWGNPSPKNYFNEKN